MDKFSGDFFVLLRIPFLTNFTDRFNRPSIMVKRFSFRSESLSFLPLRLIVVVGRLLWILHEV